MTPVAYTHSEGRNRLLLTAECQVEPRAVFQEGRVGRVDEMAVASDPSMSAITPCEREQQAWQGLISKAKGCFRKEKWSGWRSS